MVITAEVKLRGVGLSGLRESILGMLLKLGLEVLEEKTAETSFSILAIEKRVPLWQTTLFSLIGPSLIKDRVGLRIKAFKDGDTISVGIEARLYIPELDLESPRGSERGKLRAAGAINILVKELESLSPMT